ncbi:hypothetical protein HMF8227_02909 [Saliniradius amylolyticus]|uniref:GAF domain-containing protein n=1 Tax=Saliniradius amylolyticus TaxID=2183582 RepID=A0A2S2E8W4_9ALTE|nr:GAF domain-containing protein [Saliniradius amylolyticus]AWL13357.1 hypothetical protein HMF8227_02909 [Saliniradius amylolyticus]
MLEFAKANVSLLTKDQLLKIIEVQSSIIGQHLSSDDSLNAITRLAEQLTFATGAVVELVDGDEMVYRAATGMAAKNVGLRLKRETSLSGLCVKENKVLNCGDAMNDPRVDKAACEKVGLKSMLVVPMAHQDQLLGVLKVFSSKTNAFDEVDIQVLTLATKIISAVLVQSSE